MRVGNSSGYLMGSVHVAGVTEVTYSLQLV